jgi:hypothetical protein
LHLSMRLLQKLQRTIEVRACSILLLSLRTQLT